LYAHRAVLFVRQRTLAVAIAALKEIITTNKAALTEHLASG